jgi:hypothetical protein
MLVSAVDLVTKMQDPKVLIVTKGGGRKIYDSPSEGCQNPNLIMVIDGGSVVYIPIKTIEKMEIFDSAQK